MSYFPSITLNDFQNNYKDFKTVFDGQTHFFEPTDKFNKYTAGTGAVTYNATTQRYELSVTASGDVAILQQAFNNPYFAGNKQIFDITSEAMQPETNTVKYYGYFDWDSTTPDFAKIDGIYLKSQGTSVKLTISNKGTVLHEQDIEAITNWEKFNVLSCFFLWLGGAAVEPYLFMSSGMVQPLTVYSHVGQAGQFIAKPAKTITMAVVSTGGTATAKYICSMVATKQIYSWSGVQQTIYMPAQVNVGTINTYYHMKAVRVKPDYKRGASVQLERVGITSNGTNDSGILFLTRNATIALTAADVQTSLMQENSNNIGTTIAAGNIGQIISAFEFNSNAPLEHTPEYFGKFLPNNISGDPDWYHFIYLAQTSSQSVSVVTRFTEFR